MFDVKGTRAMRSAIALAFAGGLITANLAKLASFEVSDFDLGIYSNLAWNIAHGEGFHSDILNRNHLGEHFSPIIAIFAPLYLVVPTSAILLVAQILAVVATMMMLWPLLDRILAPLPQARTWSTLLVSLCLLYQPMRSGLLADFHPSVIGMPLVAGALLCLHRRDDRWLFALVLALLMTKELAIASTFGLAIYAGSVIGRRRLAFWLGAVALLAAAIIFLSVMPAHRDGSWQHLSRFGPFADPGPKLVYLVRLSLPLGLLPLLGWRALLAVIPTTGLNLMVGFAPQYGLRNHYDDQNSVFWVVAAAHGLALAGAHLAGIRWPRRRLLAVAACVAGIGLAGVGLAATFARGLPFAGLVRSWPDDRDRALHARLARYVSLPVDVPISAQSGLGPYLCHRTSYRSLSRRILERVPFADGEYILISDAASAFKINREVVREQLDADARATRIEHGPLLEVWQWHDPPSAPAASQ